LYEVSQWTPSIIRTAVEAISMSENQVASHAVHHLAERLEILLLEGREEGNNHGTNQIWIGSQKQTEKR
jgi:hypothetical protein